MISRSESLAQQIRDSIYDGIITGKLTSGETYSVSEMSQKLGVSRTPVREAVLQLEEIGLITILRNRGFRVNEVSAEDIVSAFQIRYLLEPFCAALAAEVENPEHLIMKLEQHMDTMLEASRTNDIRSFMEADKIFHDLILEQGNNVRLTQAVNAARDATYTRGLSSQSLQRAWDDINSEHRAILRAIKNYDPEHAANAMRKHVRATGEHLLHRMGYVPEETWLGPLNL